jgi:hypothetical protein
MDSKMECMRVLIERDPQSEGYFSGYSTTLGRVALRKARYLEQNPKGASVGSVPATDDFEAGGIFPNGTNNIHSTHSTASNGTPPEPGRSPAPAPPNSNPAPAVSSIFGAKLQQALHDERK